MNKASRITFIITAVVLVALIGGLTTLVNAGNRQLFLSPLANTSPTFSDVPYDHWAYVYIQGIYDAGLTTGYPDGSYRPGRSVTRAEMAVFLLKGLGVSVPPIDGSHEFIDIAGHWAEKYIEELSDQGISGGYPNETYRPERLVTRAEMAVFLLKAIHGGTYTPPTAAIGAFPDISGHWAEDWITQLAAEGITLGYPDGTFQPDWTVTRAEMAVFLVNTFNLPTPPVPTPTPTPEPIPIPIYCPYSYALPGEEQQIKDLINGARQAHGLDPVYRSDRLINIAREHGSDMTCNGTNSHTSTDGTKAWQRIGIAMYDDSNWCYSHCCCGEIFYGGGSYLTPEIAFDWWMNHEPDAPDDDWNIHKQTILGQYYNRIGVGVVYYEHDGVIRKFYTVDFCRR